ncbi:MAG: hypothetical protein V4702_04905 [Patescibacteria group bacterium]
MTRTKLSLFEHQHPHFAEDPIEAAERHRIERQLRSFDKSAPSIDSGTITVAEHMDLVADNLGLNTRISDREAEAASESAPWDLENITKSVGTASLGGAHISSEPIKAPHPRAALSSSSHQLQIS